MRRGVAAAALSNAQADAARQGVKAMMPFDRPFLDYSLSVLADAGIRRAVLVIGPEHAAVRTYFADTAAGRRVSIDFAVQAEPLGTADAVLAAATAVGDEPFLTLNGDNLYPASAVAALAALPGPGLVAFEAEALATTSGIEPSRILRFALLDLDADDRLIDLVEKPDPDHPLARRSTRWVSMNLWRFTPAIFSACRGLAASPRGELELQDAVRRSQREGGLSYQALRSSDAVLDLSGQADIAAVGAGLAAMEARP
jgi:glucose-1-phosphate thymidylyltransferase